MPVSDDLKTEIDSAITETVEVATADAAVEATATEAVATESKVEGQADTDVQVEAEVKATEKTAVQDDAQAEIDAKATEEAEAAAEIEADETEAAAKVAAEKLAKEKTSGTPTKPAISNYALLQAERVGIDPDVARQFPDEGSLLRAVIGITERMQATNDAAGEGEEEEDPLAEFPDLDPEIYEQDTIKVFDAMKNVLKKQNETIKAMQSQHEQAAANSQQASAAEVERWFDTQVESLGDNFADALGTGGYSSLDRGSSQFAKRDAIASQMAVLLAGYQASGIQAPPREQVFDSAAKLVLSDEFSSLKEKKLLASLSKRSKQHIARANGQNLKSNGSPQDEVAAILDEQFFSKK